ncbi:hypothetical protein [Idiomarina sp. HP20-50]|uniref:hypothetical protein n=1 Tax=Idiomarina sp. HP20-50 TaxID=3070813 RepID=UPI00294B97C7|nr:hypothetical protein [Idiomarina sp. HP20-50]MDV6315850.1 hypothetical protein [Idiomarina sp. HP20-50]
MQKHAVNTNQLKWSTTWGYKVLLCLLLITFNTATFASLNDSSDKYLTTQKAPDSAFIIDLSSSISEVQADEPELDKAANATSKTFQSLPPITYHFQTRVNPLLTKWNWHLVRGPPTHL